MWWFEVLCNLTHHSGWFKKVFPGNIFWNRSIGSKIDPVFLFLNFVSKYNHNVLHGSCKILNNKTLPPPQKKKWLYWWLSSSYIFDKKVAKNLHCIFYELLEHKRCFAILQLAASFLHSTVVQESCSYTARICQEQKVNTYFCFCSKMFLNMSENIPSNPKF